MNISAVLKLEMCLLWFTDIHPTARGASCLNLTFPAEVEQTSVSLVILAWVNSARLAVYLKPHCFWNLCALCGDSTVKVSPRWTADCCLLILSKGREGCALPYRENALGEFYWDRIIVLLTTSSELINEKMCIKYGILRQKHTDNMAMYWLFGKNSVTRVKGLSSDFLLENCSENCSLIPGSWAL